MLPAPSQHRLPARGIALALSIAAVVALGLAVRQAAWNRSAAARFPGDVLNAYRWGGQANKVGVFSLYREVEAGATDDRSMYLDYPPLRLLVVARWVAWTRHAFPRARTWDRSAAFVAPLLWMNVACELLAALATFALVALWCGRAASARPPPAGWTATPASLRQGAFAALLVWFDPALIWDAHVWPQWDAWASAFALLGTLAASLGRWWTAGFVLGAGALLKGQVTTLAPFVLLWAAFVRPRAAPARLTLGFATAVACGAAPWLLGTGAGGRWAPAGASILWTLRAVLAAALLFPWPALRARRGARACALLAAALALLLPGGLGAAAWGWATAALALVVAARSGPRPPRRAGIWIATGLLAGLALCVPLFDADLAWLRMGFFYGSRHYPVLIKGNAANLASLLATAFPQWHGALLPGVRILLSGTYLAAVALAAWATARAAALGEPRVLAALAAPWLAFFAFLPQMHERYLTFAAVATAGFAAVSLEALALHGVVSAVALALMVPPGILPDGARAVLYRDGQAHPALAWILLAVTVRWLALASGRRRAHG